MEHTDETVRLTSDVLAFARHNDVWHILMIQRRWEPFRGQWAFPGRHVDPGETFRAAAARELTEETGLRLSDLRQLGIYDQPDRDPRGRYVTVAFFTVVRHQVKPTMATTPRPPRGCLCRGCYATAKPSRSTTPTSSPTPPRR